MREDVSDKIIGLIFRRDYYGSKHPISEDSTQWLKTKFICVVTDKTKRNGYDYDKDMARDYLEVGKEYTLNSMSVSQSSSSLMLDEIPNVGFNTVNFEIYEP
jgi:hypothetical protein